MTPQPFAFNDIIPTDGDIRKSDIRQFLDDLEKQAHTLYATVLALPESLFWIVQEDTEQTFSVAGFIENYENFDSCLDSFCVGFNVYFFRDEWDEIVSDRELTDNFYNGEDRFEAVSRNELSVEIFTGEFPHLLASICRQAILGNEPLEATPETAAQYGFSPEEMNALGAQIARCNRRIIAELREDYERLKAIDCLHREPESLPEGENPA